jgi:hypothetical protein
MTSRFDERAKERVRELIELGERVKESARTTSSGSTVLDFALYRQWTTSSLTFLAAALGQESAHYGAFVEIGEMVGHPVAKADECLGVLRAAGDDIESGWVGRRDLLLTADAFESFLEQADYLLEQGFKNPAAMLGGAVLESTLRKMCEARGIPTDKRDKIGTLNNKLAKEHKPPAYSSAYHKQIIAWADLRNNADHGHFGEYEPEHVRAMITGVREFAARHLA